MMHVEKLDTCPDCGRGAPEWRYNAQTCTCPAHPPEVADAREALAASLSESFRRPPGSSPLAVTEWDWRDDSRRAPYLNHARRMLDALARGGIYLTPIPGLRLRNIGPFPLADEVEAIARTEHETSRRAPHLPPWPDVPADYRADALIFGRALCRRLALCRYAFTREPH